MASTKTETHPGHLCKMSATVLLALGYLDLPRLTFFSQVLFSILLFLSLHALLMHSFSVFACNQESSLIQKYHLFTRFAFLKLIFCYS